MKIDEKRLREKRQAIIAKMQEATRAALKENRAMTTDEEQAWAAMDKEQEELRGQIAVFDRAREADEQAADMAEEMRRAAVDNPETARAGATAEQRATQYTGAFTDWMRNGSARISNENRQLLMQRAQAIDVPQEARALATGIGASGGFLIPEGFNTAIERATLEFGGMRAAGCTVLQTATGNDLPWPTINDTANKSRLIAEGAEAATSGVDPAFARVTLRAWTYTTDIVKIPLQLLQDSAVNLETLLASLFAERAARGTNEHFTTGSGVLRPNGIVTAATLGKTAASTTAITYLELIDLEHSVDPSYRRKPSTRFMFNDAVLKLIKKLQDAENRPLWQAGIRENEPDRILGYQYTINQDMAAPTTGNKTVLFGDMSKYMIRDVLPPQMFRFDEKYMDELMVGFTMFHRHDGHLVDAGTNPVKYLAQA